MCGGAVHAPGPATVGRQPDLAPIDAWWTEVSLPVMGSSAAPSGADTPTVVPAQGSRLWCQWAGLFFPAPQTDREDHTK